MDQGSMSTVIEHGVVDPKPTVKAVAYCKGPIFLTQREEMVKGYYGCRFC